MVALDRGSGEEFGTGGDTVIIVPLSGQGICTFGSRDNPFARSTVFTEQADIFYLPPRLDTAIKASEPAELAIGGAPAEGRLPARVIRHSEISVGIRGEANVKRSVSALADSDQLTERLTVYEIRTPSGNWSSFPPHRHDTGITLLLPRRNAIITDFNRRTDSPSSASTLGYRARCRHTSARWRSPV